MSLILAGISLVLCAIMGFVIYKENKLNNKPTPDSLGLLSWFQSKHHWNDFGHFFLQFCLTFMTVLFSCLVIKYVSFMGFAKDFLQDSTILFCLACSIPSILLTLYIEIVQDEHWKSFVGVEDDTRDFIFDVYTHITGAISASLFIASLFLCLK